MTVSGFARIAPPRIDGLRGRAIDTALRLIELKGPDGVNVRAIAAELETGAASLYYHFASKDALLAELAALGFRLLEKSLSAALSDGRDRKPLHACGEGYLQFLRERPRLYALMYSERLLSRYAVARVAERRAFEAFSQGLGARSATDVSGSDEALALWALGRGIAALTLAAGPPADPPAREIAQRIVRGLEGIMGQPIR